MTRDGSWGHEASMTYVQMVSSEAALSFCSRFEKGSGKWYSAVTFLQSHPKEKVIGYLRESAQSQDRLVRCHCSGSVRTMAGPNCWI